MMTAKIVEYINLLYFANQTGRKMSKLSLTDLEYLAATNVSGHFPLKIFKTKPSTRMTPIQIQSHLSILLFMTAYNM